MGKTILFHERHKDETKNLFIFEVRSGGLGKLTYSKEPGSDAKKAIPCLALNLTITLHVIIYFAFEQIYLNYSRKKESAVK